MRELQCRCRTNEKHIDAVLHEAADAKAKLSIAESKLASLQRETQCSICYDKPRDCVLLPCTCRARAPAPRSMA